jgi:hypothetical protein
MSTSVGRQTARKEHLMAISPLGVRLNACSSCISFSTNNSDNASATSAQTVNPSLVYMIPAANTSNQGSSQNSTLSTFTQMASQMLSSAFVGFGLLLSLAGLASLFNNRGGGVAKEASNNRTKYGYSSATQ